MPKRIIPAPSKAERQVIFGDGLRAQIFDIRQGDKDQNGRPLITFILKPLEHLAWGYQLQDEDYTDQVNWRITRSYPKEKCICINPSPFTTTWLVLLTFDGRPGLEIEELNKSLAMRFQMAEQENEILRKYVARLQKDIETYAQHPEVYKDTIMSDVERLGKAAGYLAKQQQEIQEQNG